MSIYDSKIFEPIISKIDDCVPGFYALFDRRMKFNYRIANLITGDVLRYIVCDVIKLTGDVEKYYDHQNRTPLEVLVKIDAKRLQSYTNYFSKK